MKIVEQTFEHNGHIFKTSDGKIYCQGFVTTIDNHSMHYTLIEIKQEHMTEEFKKILKENKLL